jgi:hypothetical protein
MRRIDLSTKFSSQKLPIVANQIDSKLIVKDLLEDQDLSLNVRKTKPMKKASPLKQDIAKKFVGIMEDLGVYNFDKDDFTS